MEVTLLGMFTSVNGLSLNAAARIVNTELGIDTVEIPLCSNADVPMMVTGFPPRVAGITRIVGQAPTQPVTVTLPY